MEGLLLIGAYVVVAAVGEAIAVSLGLITDSINETMSLLVFFVFSALFLGLAWPVALRISGRFSKNP